MQRSVVQLFNIFAAESELKRKGRIMLSISIGLANAEKYAVQIQPSVMEAESELKKKQNIVIEFDKLKSIDKKNSLTVYLPLTFKFYKS